MAIKYHEIEVTKRVVESLSCDRCSVNIPVVFPNSESHQGEQMLTIALIGGYGEFIDGSGEAQFCKRCAEHLFELFPSLEAVVHQI